MTSVPSDSSKDPKQPANGPPIDVSRPIGDAIPTPVEPGLDQPLPEKGADTVGDDDSSGGDGG